MTKCDHITWVPEHKFLPDNGYTFEATGTRCDRIASYFYDSQDRCSLQARCIDHQVGRSSVGADLGRITEDEYVVKSIMES